MIHLSVHDQRHLRICVDDCVATVQMLLGSLLTSQMHRQQGFWTLNWPDFKALRIKLDALGLRDGRTADPQALEWIAAQLEEDARIERIKAGAENDMLGALPNVRTKLYLDQRTGSTFLLTRPGSVLADEMGIGKTLELLACFAAMKQQNPSAKLLVLCPNTVKTGWVKEVEKHTSLSCFVLGNGTAKIDKGMQEYSKARTDVLVVHYDSLTSSKSKDRLVIWSELVDQLIKLSWDMIVLDEAHQVKNLGAKRTQAAMHLVNNLQRTGTKVCLATGTPISESPLDAWAVLSFLDSSLLPKTFSRFEQHFLVKKRRITRTKTWMEVVGYQNLNELKDLLQRVMIRRLKSDIKGMPDKVEMVRYIPMHGDQRQLYDDIKRGVYDAIASDPSDKLSIAFAMTKVMRLRQVLNHPRLVECEGESAKYAALDELLEEICADPLAKVVIWTEFREAVMYLTERYVKKYGVIQLMGGTTQNELSRWSKEWDTMPERLAIGIPAFGGTGVDFLQRARTAIYVEPPYSTILFRQSMDRIHRRVGGLGTDSTPIDQLKTSPATLIFLQVNNSIDELVYKLLAKKGSLVDALLVEDDKLHQLGKADLLAYLK